MSYAVGKGKELFILLAGDTLRLLVAIHLNLRTHGVVARHIFLDLLPLPLLAIGEVDRLVVDKHILDGGHLEELARRHLYIYRSVVVAAVDFENTFVAVEIITEDMQKGSHIEVADDGTSVAVLVIEHI